METRPQSRGDKRDPVAVKSSAPAPSRYPGHPEDPRQRSGDVAIVARDQISNVKDTPQAPAGARALQTSGFQMPETGAEETSDKKTSKSKKSMKQESKEIDGKDKSKGAFWSRRSDIMFIYIYLLFDLSLLVCLFSLMMLRLSFNVFVIASSLHFIWSSSFVSKFQIIN